jgi:acyl dehydratase
MNVTKKTLYFEDCIEGKVWLGGMFVLYEQEIINFAEQWDPQAIHVNKALAEKSFYGGLIAQVPISLLLHQSFFMSFNIIMLSAVLKLALKYQRQRVLEIF